MEFWSSLYRVPAAECLSLARSADEAGWTGLFLSDHLVTPLAVRSVYPYADLPTPTPKDGARAQDPPVPWSIEDDFPDVFVASGMMAAVTERLRFLQAVYVLPLRDPFQVAKALGTAAHLSSGRVGLGFGIGWLEEEFDLLGSPFPDRGRRAEEMLDVMRGLWSGEPFAHHGEFYDFEAVVMRPGLSQPPPIVMGGVSERALDRAARRADGWIPPVSIASMADLLDCVGRLRSRREAAGREESPFVIYAYPPAEDALDLDHYRRLEEVGIEAVIHVPWSEMAESEERVRALAEFSERVIEPLRVSNPG